MRRLRFEPGVKFALVQSDVYQAFIDQAREGNTEAARMVNPLRVIMPLYNEEIYFIVRADAPLEHIHDIKDRKINVGLLGSGTALSATTLYRLMFGAPTRRRQRQLPEQRGGAGQAHHRQDARRGRGRRRAGEPAKLLTEMKPEVRQYIKLLKLDPKHDTTRAALTTYFPATISAANYPNLLERGHRRHRGQGLPGDLQLHRTRRPCSTCASSRSRCAATSRRLQAEGHPKWKEVALALPALGKGWSYSPATERHLRAWHPAGAIGLHRAPKRANCSQQERVLGLRN